MAVAFDAGTLSATFTTVTPFTFTHTPVGSPKAVVVKIYHAQQTTDMISGAVTYGGVALTRQARATVATGGLEQGATYLYSLVSGSIPTGPQTVSITHTGSAQIKVAVSETYTATGVPEVLSPNTNFNDQAIDPQVSVNTDTRPAMATFGVYSGFNAPTDLTLLANETAVQNWDFGLTIARADRETVPTGGARQVGYTTSTNTDRWAIAAIALAEPLPPPVARKGRRRAAAALCCERLT